MCYNIMWDHFFSPWITCGRRASLLTSTRHQTIINNNITKYPYTPVPPPQHLRTSISVETLAKGCNEFTRQITGSFGAAVFYWVTHIKYLALQTNRDAMLVSATMLRTGLYYSFNTVKQLASGGCEKVTQDITGHGPSHHRSLNRAGDKRVAQAKPHQPEILSRGQHFLFRCFV